MRKAQRILLIALLLVAFLPCATALAWGDKEPTAIIVDDETGEPIEGAIALANWTKHSITLRAWWEGGTTYTARAEEADSDAEGRIYIAEYWGRRPFVGKRRLTVYKPGYVLWDSDMTIFWEHRDPSEFNSDQCVIRMRRFEDKFFERLAGKFPGAKYPHVFHAAFLSLCTFGINLYEAKLDSRLLASFRKHELPFQLKEQRQIDIENKKRNREDYQKALEKFNKSKQQKRSN